MMGLEYDLEFLKKKNSIKIHNNHFCSIWKSNGISFNKTIEELKVNFKVVDSVISDKLVKNLLIMDTNQRKFNLN